MSSPMNPLSPPLLQRGVALLEVLIAVLILAIGLLGLAGLQAQALKTNQSSFQRTRAVMLSYFILDAMRADRQAMLTGAYERPKTCGVPAGGTLAQYNINFWIQEIKNSLGNTNESCGLITCNAAGDCTVQIWWDDSRAGGGVQQMIETRTRL